MVNDLRARGWWSKEWSVEEGDDELVSTPSLWEAEVAALSDEQLAALVESAEDSG